MNAAVAGTWMPSANPSSCRSSARRCCASAVPMPRHGDGGAAQHCGAHTERECLGCFAAFHSLLPLVATIEYFESIIMMRQSQTEPGSVDPHHDRAGPGAALLDRARDAHDHHSHRLFADDHRRPRFLVGGPDAAGDLVAASELEQPTHISALSWSARAVIAKYGDDIGPGDLYLHNDPYTGGSHLNDVGLFYPVFRGERPLAIIGVMAHWQDIGGMVPGSLSGSARDIYQEGIRIPVVAHRAARRVAVRGARVAVRECAATRRPPRRSERDGGRLPHRRAQAARDGRSLRRCHRSGRVRSAAHAWRAADARCHRPVAGRRIRLSNLSRQQR